MLDDILVTGIDFPILPEFRMLVDAGPRAYSTKVKQGREDVPTKPAYCFVGKPVSQQQLEQIRAKYGFSTNYGAVFIPDRVLIGLNPESTPAIVGVERDHCMVRGLLPIPALRWEAQLRGYLSREQGREEMVFASPEDFPGLTL